MKYETLHKWDYYFSLDSTLWDHYFLCDQNDLIL